MSLDQNENTQSRGAAARSPRIRHLRVHIKELAAEAGFIRHEERQCTGPERWKLQHHRKTVVRQAARRYQLAYACLRGKPYSHVEVSVRDVDEARRALSEAAKIAARFGAAPGVVEEWMLEAAEHLHN